MKYMIYNMDTDKMTISDEKPKLVDSYDCYVPLERYDCCIRFSDWLACEAHKIAFTSYYDMEIDGEMIHGHLSEDRSRLVQVFDVCKGRELKLYERRRDDVDSPWEKWKLLSTTKFE